MLVCENKKICPYIIIVAQPSIRRSFQLTYKPFPIHQYPSQNNPLTVEQNRFAEAQLGNSNWTANFDKTRLEFLINSWLTLMNTVIDPASK